VRIGIQLGTQADDPAVIDVIERTVERRDSCVVGVVLAFEVVIGAR
jgi:hypothetical protein